MGKYQGFIPEKLLIRFFVPTVVSPVHPRSMQVCISPGRREFFVQDFGFTEKYFLCNIQQHHTVVMSMSVIPTLFLHYFRWTHP